MILRDRGLRFNPMFPLGRVELAELVEDLSEVLNLEPDSFDLRLVHDPEIAVLNKEFLGCTGPTNVLSFPAGEDEERLGDIVLSVDTLERETYLYGQEPREHLVRLLAHAMLHLMGYDHGEEMYALTDMAVEAVGYEE